MYDYLAHTFCVCDSWHSSIPGDTMPNRCYSIAGEEGPSVVDKLDIFSHLVGSAVWSKLESIPIYDLKAFTRHLDDTQWRWYSHDPATLRAVDGEYRRLFHRRKDNFAYFSKKTVSLELEAAEVLFVGGQLPRRRRERDSCGCVVDRPELHRPPDLRPDGRTTTIRRPTSTPGRGSCSTCSTRS